MTISASSAPDWTNVVTAFAGIGATLFAGLAVWVAASSARAAWMTAQRSIDAADKATEALGRAIRPDLFVNLLDQGPEQGKDPHLMLLVLNRSPFAAEQVTATVNLGTQFEPVAPVSAPYIGPEEGRATFDLGPQLGPRVADFVRAEGFLTWNHVVAVEYSDRNRSLRWRQEWIFPSGANGPQTQPTHVISASGAKHPELVTAAPPPPVKPRWRDILRGRHSTR